MQNLTTKYISNATSGRLGQRGHSHCAMSIFCYCHQCTALTDKGNRSNGCISGLMDVLLLRCFTWFRLLFSLTWYLYPAEQGTHINSSQWLSVCGLTNKNGLLQSFYQLLRKVLHITSRAAIRLVASQFIIRIIRQTSTHIYNLLNNRQSWHIDGKLNWTTYRTLR